MSDIGEFFQKLHGGAFVIGVAHEGQYDIFMAASVMLASRRPLLLAVSIDRRHASYPLMRAGRVFSVSIMSKTHPEMSRRFGAKVGRPLQGPDGVAWRFGREGAPIPDQGVLACFECEMHAMMSAGDHQMMLGRVLSSDIADTGAARDGRVATKDRRRGDPVQQSAGSP